MPACEFRDGPGGQAVKRVDRLWADAVDQFGSCGEVGGSLDCGGFGRARQRARRDDGGWSGFGLMPSINLGYAAKSTAAKIAAGLGEASEPSALRELGNELA